MALQISCAMDPLIGISGRLPCKGKSEAKNHVSAFYWFFEAVGGYVPEPLVVKMPGYAPPDRGK